MYGNKLFLGSIRLDYVISFDLANFLAHSGGFHLSAPPNVNEILQNKQVLKWRSKVHSKKSLTIFYKPAASSARQFLVRRYSSRLNKSVDAFMRSCYVVWLVNQSFHAEQSGSCAEVNDSGYNISESLSYSAVFVFLV